MKKIRQIFPVKFSSVFVALESPRARRQARRQTKRQSSECFTVRSPQPAATKGCLKV